MATSSDWADWLDENRRWIDGAIQARMAALAGRADSHQRLVEAVQYSMKLGGKRLRPILVAEACRACGGTAEMAEPAAVAVECIHTFSLIHDDLPAMDNDDLRRGQPTSHRVFGEATAILAGDWLATYAFAVLVEASVARAPAGALVAALAEGTLGMVAGQSADIAGERQPPSAERVEFIHLHKTARLIEASARLGGLSAGAAPDTISDLARYGRHLGLAFQIVDDLLDVTSSTDHLGKAAGKDAAVEKQTYPSVYGLDESRARAEREVQSAIRALSSWDGRAARLREIARFVVARDR